VACFERRQRDVGKALEVQPDNAEIERLNRVAAI
jgi:hypothetical protein